MKNILPILLLVLGEIFLGQNAQGQINIGTQDLYWRTAQNQILRLSAAENGVKKQELSLRLILDNQNYKTFTSIFPIKVHLYRLSSAGATIIELIEVSSIEQLPRDFIMEGGQVVSNRISLVTKNFDGTGTFSFKIYDAQNREVRFLFNSVVKADFGISVQ